MTSRLENRWQSNLFPTFLTFPMRMISGIFGMFVEFVHLGLGTCEFEGGGEGHEHVSTFVEERGTTGSAGGLAG